MSGRRGFLKNLGLFGAVVGGAAAASAANNIINSTSTEYAGEKLDDISDLAPVTNHNTLELSTDNRPPASPAPITEVMRMDSNGFLGLGVTPPSSKLDVTAGYTSGHYFNVESRIQSSGVNKIGMAVGRDNRLWLKVGDQWKRVAVE